jgi:hypothetical protein
VVEGAVELVAVGLVVVGSAEGEAGALGTFGVDAAGVESRDVSPALHAKLTTPSNEGTTKHVSNWVRMGTPLRRARAGVNARARRLTLVSRALPFEPLKRRERFRRAKKCRTPTRRGAI